ncbi:23S rRNA pseudouridine(1911/1915/1917) synthase RluD [Plasticicumulans acidivorans]|nr:23S rRNA pseudouridine(1911/1915/1917) synthase RluD [Plasticicumulans acidivorans]
MPAPERIDHIIPAELSGQRLDQALAELLPDHSRARIQQWIKSGVLRLDGRIVKPREPIFGGERVSGEIEPEVAVADQPQDIPLVVRFEDDDILIIDKPAGLVVHPAAGNPDGTLVNALLHHAPVTAQLPRAGIVHRLDKDTSGLLVVAKSLRAHTALVEQLQARTMGREYQAIACGVLVSGGLVDVPIGRHGTDRKRMAATPGGKPAVTHFRVLERFRGHTHLALKLETGRTHQIRVHMAFMHHPLVGDPVYGGRLRLPPGCTAELSAALKAFKRQALHARKLTLTHPGSGKRMSWTAPAPADFQALLEVLRADGGADGLPGGQPTSWIDEDGVEWIYAE